MRLIKVLFFLVKSGMVHTPLCVKIEGPNHEGRSTHVDLNKPSDSMRGHSQSEDDDFQLRGLWKKTLHRTVQSGGMVHPLKQSCQGFSLSKPFHEELLVRNENGPVLCYTLKVELLPPGFLG